LMDDYTTIHQARPGWQQLLDHYAIDYIVCEQDAPLVKAASADELFVPLYRDSDTVVLVRNSARYQPLIARYRLTAS
jgi:molybdopterin-guanine dinucleotide biosynthesis protein A